MSRLRPSVVESQAGQVRPRGLAAAQAQFDKRLARSFVTFANGKGANATFDWVPEEQRRIATLAGIPLKVDSRGLERLAPAEATSLRENVIIAVSSAMALRLDTRRMIRIERSDPVVRFLDEQLSPLQIVTFWRIGADRSIEEISLPRLDSVPRCVAYILGLMFLDRHHLRRGIKPCLLTKWIASSADPPDRSSVGRVRGRNEVHLFLDIPNSKQMYCCTKHAQTHRKRRERAAAKKRLRKRK